MPTAGGGAGFARIVVAVPGHRLELAVPEHHAVGTLLPALARAAGLSGATDPDAGWSLCRADGVALDPAAPLAPQDIRDGDVLHLVPADVDWPQPGYESVVTLRGRPPSPPWWPGTTLAVAVLALAFAPLVAVPRLVQTRDWLPVAVPLLVSAAVLVLSGLILARRPGFARAGATLTAVALPHGLSGGALVLGSGEATRFALGAPQLLVGALIVALIGVVGLVSLAELVWLWLAALVAGVGGAAGGLLALGPLTGSESAAILVTALVIVGPAYPLLSVRLARVPMPAVPRNTEELLRGYPMPELSDVAVRVGRSSDLLTGLLVGTAVVTVAAVAQLAGPAGPAGPAALVLSGCVATSFMLRARLFVTARHRLIMVVAGAGAAAATVLGLSVAATPDARLGVLLPVLLVGAGLAGTAGLVYSRRGASPYLGRLADILDVLLTLALGLLAASVLGLYQAMRGLGG